MLRFTPLGVRWAAMAFLLTALAWFAAWPSGIGTAGATKGGLADRTDFDFRIEQTLGTMLPLDALPSGAQQVIVGVYPINVYELDLDANTYRMNAYVWLRWRGDFDPVGSLEFANSLELWGFTKELYLETPKELPDGSKYQHMRIEGRFFQPFDLSQYPLDRQELSLWLENTTSPIDEIVYVPDHASGYGDGVNIKAWDVVSYGASTYLHEYGTDFGDPSEPQGSRYAGLKFSFELERNANMFVWKLLIPLMIVMVTSWTALLLSPLLVEVRMAMPAGALLAVIFLRDMVMSAIPETPTLVLADIIYVLSYAFIVLTLVQIVWANLRMNKDSPANLAHLTHIDRWSFVAQIALFTLSLVLLVQLA